MAINTLQIPTRREYIPTGELIETPTSELPFVRCETDHHWDVPLTDDSDDNIEMASKIGAEYAGHYLQYLKDNPNMVGASLLGWIAKDMDYDGPSSGCYWLSFFGHLERVLYWAAVDMDVYGDIDRCDAHLDQFMDLLREDEAADEERNDIESGVTQFPLEHVKKHTINDVLTAVSGLQCIGSLLESIPHEGGVAELSEIQLTGLGNIIVALSQSIGSDMETIEGTIAEAREGLNS